MTAAKYAEARDKTVREIRAEWESRVGSQKGQYRLSHAKVGFLLTALHSQTELTGKYKGLLLVAKDLIAHVGTYNDSPIARSMKATYLLETLAAYFPDDAATKPDGRAEHG